MEPRRTSGAAAARPARRRKKSPPSAPHGEALLAAIVESSDDAIIAKDLDGIIQSWNRGAERIFGYTASEAIGQPITILTVPDRLNEIPEILDRIRRGEQIEHYETQRRTKDGRVLTVSLSISPVRDASGAVIGASKIARDLTERKRAESAVRESEQFARSIVESSRDCIKVLSLDGKLLSMNPSGQQLLCIENIADYLNAPYPDIWRGPERDACLQAIEAARAGQTGAFEGYFPTLRGEPKWWHVQITPICGGDGQVRQLLAISRDITGQKQAELLLQRANHKVENILNSITGHFVALDREWRFTYVNDHVTQSLGRARADLIGQNMWDVVPYVKDTEFWPNYHRVMEERIPLHFEAYFPPGNQWFEAHAYPTEEGMSAYILDITDQHRAEQALRLSEERFRSIVEAAAEGIWIVDPDGRTLFVNPRMAELLGYPPGELIGRSCFDFLHPDEAARGREGFEKRKLDRDLSPREYRVLRRDGTGLWLSLTASPMYGATGAMTGIVAMCTDVTGRRRNEDALRRANAALEQFAYAAAHDLQEPARNVALYTQMLARHFQGRLDARSEEFIRTVVDGAHRMLNLIRDLLSYTRATEEQDAAESDANADTVIEEVVENLRTAIEAAEARVTHGPLPAVGVRPAHLVQLLQNLVSNALKYRAEEPPRIHVSAERQGRDWRFTVRDNGQGISPEHHERIFRVFKRLHGDAIPGTGIGLAICERIVAHYGGRIWVESEPGQGAAFHFTLPPVRRSA